MRYTCLLSSLYLFLKTTSISYASLDVSRYANKWGKQEDHIGHNTHLYNIVKLNHGLVDVTEVG